MHLETWVIVISETAAPRASTVAAGNRSHRRSDIQGLRAIAVVVVIGDHLLGWPHGGFVGVDVFFVISGFLITGLLLREYDERGTISFTRFYRRRIKRIIPAATAVLIASVCASYALVSSTRFHDIIRDAAYSSAFLANYRFAKKGVDYFQQDLPPSPVQHFWSLAVEEQFYVVWPWLLLGLLVLGVRLLGRRHGHERRIAGAAIGAITLGSFVFALHQTRTDAVTAYFATPSRAWELGIGAIVAVAADRLRFEASVRTLLAWVGLAGILASMLLVPESPGFPAPWALLPVASAALVIAAGIGGSPHVPILTNRVSGYLGEISYSLYLWHFPVVVLLTALIPDATVTYALAGAGTTFVLSVLSYHLVENPARNRDWFTWDRPRRPSGIARGWYAAALAVVVVGVAAVGGHLAIRTTVPPVLPSAPVVLAGATASNPGDCSGAAALDPAHRCPGLNTGDAITPSLDVAANDIGDTFDCYSFAGQPMHRCTIGSTRSDATAVALTGDSHAAALLGALEPQLASMNWRVDVFVGNGCRWHVLTVNTAGCTAAMPDIQAALVSGGYDAVVTTAARGKPTDEVGDYVAAIKPVARTGARIVVVKDVPDAGPETIDCLNRVGFSAQSHCGLSTSAAFGTKDQLVEAAARVPGAAVVDVTDHLCVDGFCPATIGNVIVYRDTAAHLTATYARTLGPYLAEQLEAAVSGSRRAAHPQ